MEKPAARQHAQKKDKDADIQKLNGCASSIIQSAATPSIQLILDKREVLALALYSCVFSFIFLLKYFDKWSKQRQSIISSPNYSPSCRLSGDEQQVAYWNFV